LREREDRRRGGEEVITKKEMQEWLEKPASLPRPDFRNPDGDSFDEVVFDADLEMRSAISAALSTPEVKRVSVTMKTLQEIASAFPWQGLCLSEYLAVKLRSLGVEVTSGEVVDGGKPEKEG
jgi:hypothetical protein